MLPTFLVSLFVTSVYSAGWPAELLASPGHIEKIEKAIDALSLPSMFMDGQDSTGALLSVARLTAKDLANEPNILRLDLSTVPAVSQDSEFISLITALTPACNDEIITQAVLMYHVDWRLTQRLIEDSIRSSVGTIDAIGRLVELRATVLSRLQSPLVKKAFSRVNNPLFVKRQLFPKEAIAVEPWELAVDLDRANVFATLSSFQRATAFLPIIHHIRQLMGFATAPLIDGGTAYDHFYALDDLLCNTPEVTDLTKVSQQWAVMGYITFTDPAKAAISGISALHLLALKREVVLMVAVQRIIDILRDDTQRFLFLNRIACLLPDKVINSMRIMGAFDPIVPTGGAFAEEDVVELPTLANLAKCPTAPRKCYETIAAIEQITLAALSERLCFLVGGRLIDVPLMTLFDLTEEDWLVYALDDVLSDMSSESIVKFVKDDLKACNTVQRLISGVDEFKMLLAILLVVAKAPSQLRLIRQLEIRSSVETLSAGLNGIAQQLEVIRPFKASAKIPLQGIQKRHRATNAVVPTNTVVTLDEAWLSAFKGVSNTLLGLILQWTAVEDQRYSLFSMFLKYTRQREYFQVHSHARLVLIAAAVAQVVLFGRVVDRDLAPFLNAASVVSLLDHPTDLLELVMWMRDRPFKATKADFFQSLSTESPSLNLAMKARSRSLAVILARTAPTSSHRSVSSSILANLARIECMIAVAAKSTAKDNAIFELPRELLLMHLEEENSGVYQSFLARFMPSVRRDLGSEAGKRALLNRLYPHSAMEHSAVPLKELPMHEHLGRSPSRFEVPDGPVDSVVAMYPKAVGELSNEFIEKRGPVLWDRIFAKVFSPPRTSSDTYTPVSQMAAWLMNALPANYCKLKNSAMLPALETQKPWLEVLKHWNIKARILSPNWISSTVSAIHGECPLSALFWTTFNPDKCGEMDLASIGETLQFERVFLHAIRNKKGLAGWRSKQRIFQLLLKPIQDGETPSNLVRMVLQSTNAHGEEYRRRGNFRDLVYDLQTLLAKYPAHATGVLSWKRHMELLASLAELSDITIKGVDLQTLFTPQTYAVNLVDLDMVALIPIIATLAFHSATTVSQLESLRKLLATIDGIYNEEVSGMGPQRFLNIQLARFARDRLLLYRATSSPADVECVSGFFTSLCIQQPCELTLKGLALLGAFFAPYGKFAPTNALFVQWQSVLGKW